ARQRAHSTLSSAGRAPFRLSPTSSRFGFWRAHPAHPSEQRFEKVTERTASSTGAAAKQVVDIDRAFETAASAPVRRRRKVGAVLPIRSQLIEFLTLFGIAQDLVRFLNFFELFLGLVVVRIQVGMVLAGKLPIRLLDFFFFRGSRHAQNFVIIAKLNRHDSEFTTP